MVRRILLLGLLLVFPAAAGAATIDNDDSCDIAVLPAATLLLPYFEVDLDDAQGETTLFTITNVTNVDQVAHVTLWTDRAYPVIDFNIYLTGYDVQAINLFDIIERGVIAPDAGTGTFVTPRRGRYSDRNTVIDLSDCDRLPGPLDNAYVERMQDAFTEGRVEDLGIIEGCERVGNVHEHAIGYATIDVVGRCSVELPTSRAYWSQDIRYDNVLIGDYQQINSRENFAQGGPMVHIRAIPEGGTPAVRTLSKYDAGFAQTFYGRYQTAAEPHLDGRQPLPTQFATRWISGGANGYGTSLKVWREGRDESASCDSVEANAELDATEFVIFDESENPVGAAGATVELPAVSRNSVADANVFPQPANAATSGWMYVNLDRAFRDDRASQSWVISSMRALGRFSTDTEAIALGNGCTPDVRSSEISRASSTVTLGPAPNDNGPARGVASVDNDDSCDIAQLPAATLLLPYFEVDLDDRSGETTLFTITNAHAAEQIARVTLWTDYSFPVISFNVYLTGYDVQSINLFDVIASGRVAPDQGTGDRVTPRGPYSDRNLALDRSFCHRIPVQLAEGFIERMQDAFTYGEVEDFGGEEGCNEVGGVHDNAVGYATIDLVRNCSTNGPLAAEYWSEDLAYDNVLIGDYQQVHSANNFAQSAPLVHVRAVPEGGTPAERRADRARYEPKSDRTFYSRYQSTTAPKLDGRQPLPSTFAARWIQGGANSYQTFFKSWREGKTGRDAKCGLHDDNVVKVMETVRFDEAENAVGDVPVSRVCTPITVEFTLPSTSLTSVADASVFPQLTNGAVAGWMYLNLDNCERDSWGSQNWVVFSMRAEGRYSVDVDAAALGNGCSPPAAISEVTTGSAIIGPAPNAN